PLGMAAAIPTAHPVARPGALPDPMLPYGSPQLPVAGDPMAALPIDGLLPPEAAFQESPASTCTALAESSAPRGPAAELRMQTAPSAARFGQQRSRQAQRGLALMFAGCVALVAVAASAYWFGLRHSPSEPIVVAETPSPEPKVDPQPVA